MSGTPSRGGRIRSLIANPVTQNALALYGVQIATVLIPVLTLPYLARVLDPAGLGVLAVAQSLSGFLYLALDYGFSFSASRDIAHVRDDRQGVARIVAGVVGAQVLLTALAAAVTAVCILTVPLFRDQPEYALYAFADAVALTFNPLWYFRGIERLRLTSIARLAARIAAAAGLFVIVTDPADGWKVLALQFAFDVVAAVVCLAVMYRGTPFVRPRLGEAWEALRRGATLFVANAAISLYTVANAFVLGLLVPAAQVGFFNGGERISRAVLKLVGPVSDALFPRVAYLLGQGEVERAREIARRTVVWLGLLSLVAGGALAALAPVVVDVLLGPGYEPAVPVMRVLAILIPLLMLSAILGLQWMVPLKLDRVFRRVVLVAGPLNVVLLLVLAPPHGAMGGAVAVVITEAFVTLGLAVELKRRDLLPVGRRRPAAAG